jgi:GGDEF domain-containing protein
LQARLRRVEIEKYNEVQWSAGRTSLTITAIRRSVADRLNVALSTDTGEGHKYKVYIVDGALTNNDNARYLNRLIKYIHKGGL